MASSCSTQLNTHLTAYTDCPRNAAASAHGPSACQQDSRSTQHAAMTMQRLCRRDFASHMLSAQCVRPYSTCFSGVLPGRGAFFPPPPAGSLLLHRSPRVGLSSFSFVFSLRAKSDEGPAAMKVAKEALWPLGDATGIKKRERYEKKLVPADSRYRRC